MSAGSGPPAVIGEPIPTSLYDNPGPDFYTRLHPDRAKHRALDQLRTMGYNVTLSPLEAAAG